MRTYALVGGMGAGKSTVARRLARRYGGVRVDADRLGHRVLRLARVRRRLLEEFGPDIVPRGGDVDRRRLGARVFGHRARLERLNGIVHPEIAQALARRLARERQRGTPFVLLDAALYFEFDPRPPVDGSAGGRRAARGAAGTAAAAHRARRRVARCAAREPTTARELDPSRRRGARHRLPASSARGADRCGLEGAPSHGGAPGEGSTWRDRSIATSWWHGSLISRSVFDVAKLGQELEALERRTAATDFWDDAPAARDTLAALKHHRGWLDPVRQLEAKLGDLGDLEALARSEGDAATLADVQRDLVAADALLEELELRLMLGGEDDEKSALLVIHPGTGGLEAQDWAEMLLRMYTRYCERHGWSFEVLDLQAGEGAGIKSATLEVNGEYAFGRLRSEAGVHRLIRISPFDANQRRQTSFASVAVYPEIESDVKVEIKDADLRIDTYRASGAGGQHVNKTSSAVRITHLPTKIVVQCQNERSQLRNRESAMKILRARLYQHYKEIETAKRQEKEPEKKEIGFGSQIRTYTFQPYTLVKDHRTGVDAGDVQAVMDGALDAFVEGYLKWANEVRSGPRP